MSRIQTTPRGSVIPAVHLNLPKHALPCPGIPPFPFPFTRSRPELPPPVQKKKERKSSHLAIPFAASGQLRRLSGVQTTGPATTSSSSPHSKPLSRRPTRNPSAGAAEIGRGARGLRGRSTARAPSPPHSLLPLQLLRRPELGLRDEEEALLLRHRSATKADAPQQGSPPTGCCRPTDRRPEQAFRAIFEEALRRDGKQLLELKLSFDAKAGRPRHVRRRRDKTACSPTTVMAWCCRPASYQGPFFASA